VLPCLLAAPSAHFDLFFFSWRNTELPGEWRLLTLYVVSFVVPNTAFFLFEKIGKKKETILFYGHYLVDLLI